MFTRILLCTDGSKGAQNAACIAGEIAKRFQAHLLVLHVSDLLTQLPPTARAPQIGLPSEVLRRYLEEDHNAALMPITPILDSAGVKYSVCRKSGYPAETVLQVAKELEADLIVLGSRGLGRFQSLLLGSVSDRVVHHAHCPVLIAR